MTAKGAVATIATAWLALNGAIGRLYFLGILDKGILLLICLAYSGVRYGLYPLFCPFQTWFMKNKCCATCRICHWDCAMMFTPLAFMRGRYIWSLAGFCC